MGWPSDINGSSGLVITNGKLLQHERFTGRWKKFETCAKDLLAFSKHIVSLEEVLDRKSALESEIGSKETVITSYKVGREQMLEGFAENYRSWKAQEIKLTEEVRAALGRVQSLEDTLAVSKKNTIGLEELDRKIQDERNKTDQVVAEAIKERSLEIQKLQRRIDITSKKLEKEQSDLVDKSMMLIGREEQLRTCRKELEERRKEIGWEHLDTDLPSDLMELSMRLHDLVERYFFKSLPKDIDTDSLFIKLQRSQFMSTISRPIPISSSQPSKHLRMAAVEAIVSMKMMEKIFQPLFTVQSPDRNVFCNALDRLSKSPKQEAILRTILTTAFVSDVRETNLVNAIVEEIDLVLAPLFLSQVDRVAFKIDLKALLHSAAEIWSRTQKSPEKIVASSEGRPWDWGYHQEHERAVRLSAEQIALAPISDYPLMILFPRVYIDKAETPLHRGFALWSDQSLMIAGDLEFREQATRVNVRNTDMHGGSMTRRGSIKAPDSSPLTRRRTVSLPSSPRSTKSGHGNGNGNGTFLKRTQQSIGPMTVSEEFGAC